MPAKSDVQGLAATGSSNDVLGRKLHCRVTRLGYLAVLARVPRSLSHFLGKRSIHHDSPEVGHKPLFIAADLHQRSEFAGSRCPEQPVEGLGPDDGPTGLSALIEKRSDNVTECHTFDDNFARSMRLRCRPSSAAGPSPKPPRRLAWPARRSRAGSTTIRFSLPSCKTSEPSWRFRPAAPWSAGHAGRRGPGQCGSEPVRQAVAIKGCLRRAQDGRRRSSRNHAGDDGPRGSRPVARA